MPILIWIKATGCLHGNTVRLQICDESRVAVKRAELFLTVVREA
uniref:Uncharacterized protein n=1 Tax=Picea sitchensis TaxID=3332 RepID=A9NMW1_PICSI|nr:unknown [Picea sitchensis]